jgi:L-fuculose-phosphate aldolase
MAYGANGKNGNTNGYGVGVSEFKLKEQMCEIGRRIWLKGYCAGNEGNHSCRIGPDRVLCTPTGISKGFLKPDDVCTVDMEGKQISGKRKRTSEILMHLTIYKARPDVKAVVHSHPPHATAFAIANVELPTCIHPEAEVFLGAVKTAKYVTPGDLRLGESLLPYVKDTNTILLQNHGTVTYDVDLENAYYKLEIVDAYSRILLLAKSIGQIRPLDSNEMKELLDLKVRFGLREPRLEKGGEGMTCSTDFLTRVGSDVATKGRMQVDGSTVASPTSGGSKGCACPSNASPVEQAIAALAPANMNEGDMETLIQTITDQIMATA